MRRFPIPALVPAQRRGLHWAGVSFLLVAAGALLWVGLRAGDWLPGSGAEALEGAPVQRGPLEITVVASGHLQAAETVSLTSKIEGRTTILSIVPEGTLVEKGQLVCELDASTMAEERIEQSIALGNAEAALVKARQNYQIQESQNRTDLAQARRAVEFAELDLAMFLEGERESLLEAARQAIDLASEEKERARVRYSWSEQLADRGFLTTTELEADRISLRRAEVTLEQAQRDLDLMERFQMPKRETELSAAVTESEQELERVELQAAARLVDYEADLRSCEARAGLEREKLAKLDAQIEEARIRAPRAGMVVYAQMDHDDPPIQEGREVRERQEILSIPSTDGMTAVIKLHESVLKQVEVGQLAMVRIDALPDQEFEGRVEFVALLPDQSRRWSNPNQRVYSSEIGIRSPTLEMRPGMSCSVEILIESLPDAIYVPVQAVHRTSQGNIAFVALGAGHFETRAVLVGRFNELWVQVLDGLAEGETVLLQPPPGYKLESIEDQEASEDVEMRDVEVPEAGAADAGAAAAEAAGDGAAGDGAAVGAETIEGELPAQESSP